MEIYAKSSLTESQMDTKLDIGCDGLEIQLLGELVNGEVGQYLLAKDVFELQQLKDYPVSVVHSPILCHYGLADVNIENFACDEESVIWAILAIFALLISLYFIKIDLTPKIYKFYCQKDIHQYKEIDATDNMTTIYCPICKKEKEIETKEWNKMQADKKYPFIVD